MKGSKVTAILLLPIIVYGFWHRWAYTRRPLFFGIESGMSRAEFDEYLTAIKADPANETNTTDKGLEGVFDTFEIKDFQYRAVEGTLKIDFYRDQICEISYYPDNYQLFTNQALGKAYPSDQFPVKHRDGVTIQGAELRGVAGATWLDDRRYNDLIWFLASTG